MLILFQYTYGNTTNNKIVDKLQSLDIIHSINCHFARYSNRSSPVPGVQLRGDVQAAGGGLRLPGAARATPRGLHLLRAHAPRVEERQDRHLHALSSAAGGLHRRINGRIWNF